MQYSARRHTRLTTRLFLIVVAMFLFAVFVMPIFYDTLCRLTGLNGKASLEQVSSEGMTAKVERALRIQFIARTDKGIPWRFSPETRTLMVHPGEVKMTHFTVENMSSSQLISSAVPSISPAQATRYFKKTQCFCFERQALEGNTKKEMPLIFYVDPALPDHIRTITLSYTLYPTRPTEKKDVLAKISI